MLISDEHFAYLVLQVGSIDHLKENRKLWEEAYHKRLVEIYDSIVRVLPWPCRRVLDIGSGLGGIHYHLQCFNPNMETYLLDGLADPPIHYNSYTTFNNMSVANDFLNKNGVRLQGWYTPRDMPKPPTQFDLVLSFASWCFHYNPESYLPMVKACSKSGTMVIVDVRKEYNTWRRTLSYELGEPRVLFEDNKLIRCAYSVK